MVGQCALLKPLEGWPCQHNYLARSLFWPHLRQVQKLEHLFHSSFLPLSGRWLSMTELELTGLLNLNSNKNFLHSEGDFVSRGQMSISLPFILSRNRAWLCHICFLQRTVHMKCPSNCMGKKNKANICENSVQFSVWYRISTSPLREKMS